MYICCMYVCQREFTTLLFNLERLQFGGLKALLILASAIKDVDSSHMRSAINFHTLSTGEVCWVHYTDKEPEANRVSQKELKSESCK